MCISSEEFNSIKSRIKSIEVGLDKHTTSYNNAQQKLLWFIISNIAVLVGIGVWAGSLNKDVAHNRDMIQSRTEDRFYKSDGAILETKISNIDVRQDRLEDQFDTIDRKLDRLIEKNFDKIEK